MLDKKMKKDYEIFNIGTGRPVSVLELVKTFEKVNNLKLNYKFAPRRAGDTVAIWADTTLANKELRLHGLGRGTLQERANRERANKRRSASLDVLSKSLSS